MTAGTIVVVDWRDALPGSGEPNKLRPAVIVGSENIFGHGLPFEVVVPLTGEQGLAVFGASLAIAPSPENRCTKTCYALSWCVQTIPHVRLVHTAARITEGQLLAIRTQIASAMNVYSN